MKNNIIQEKSFEFAARMVNMHGALAKRKVAVALTDQVLLSGISIGVKVESAISASSESDFLAGIVDAYQAANTTHYYLRLLDQSNYLSSPEAASILEDCDELLKILGAIRKKMELRTSKKNTSD